MTGTSTAKPQSVNSDSTTQEVPPLSVVSWSANRLDLFARGG
jgi:hypothetical protein